MNSCYVMLHIGRGPGQTPTALSPSLIVTDLNKKFSFSDEMWIERLDERLFKNVQTACEPPNLYIDMQRWDRHLYAFVRKVPRGERTLHEGMTDLFTLVALSRLINPTSTGDRYCAKVFQIDGEKSPIQAIQWQGMSPDVFLGSRPRDWLSVQDGETLRKLLPWVTNSKLMHGRVQRAYWYHEYAMRSYYMDVRLPLVVTGLEALISIGTTEMRRQFVNRLTQVARDLTIDLNKDELDDAYTLRSKLAHAEGFLYKLETILPQSEQRERHEKVESLLRAILMRSLLDDAFGDSFRDDASIKARWPV